MTTTVNVPDFKSLPDVKLHHLPCNIKTNDAANISTFFQPTMKETNGKEVRSATFRGRPLDGEVMAPPDGYVGFVVREKRKPFSEDEDRTLDVVGKFDSFTKWHLDSKYTSDSTIDKAVSVWPAIAKGIHSPIEPQSSKVKLEVKGQ
uniref:ribonuclease H2 subunit C-like n=1 Tax=Styela clava TaxID=7725 RepID=UPI00193A5D18|nr:ribonuclease H2 subunit C-like [Styela clava]